MARADAQQRFATQEDGATIITDHIQAWLLTAMNLMKLARPDPDFRLQQPHGPALEIMAIALLDTLQGTIALEMKMGIAAGNLGEVQIHSNRLVFTRPLNERIPSNSSTIDRSTPESRTTFWRLFHLFYPFESLNFWVTYFQVHNRTVHMKLDTPFHETTIFPSHIY